MQCIREEKVSYLPQQIEDLFVENRMHGYSVVELA